MCPHLLARESTLEKATRVYKMNSFQIHGNYHTYFTVAKGTLSNG